VDDTGNVLDIGRKRRSVSAPLMRALMMRDRHCVFPGCSCSAYLEAHHIEHWMRGGETSLRNTAILCWRHHAALHEGGFRMQRDDDGVLQFFDPSGCPIEPAPRAPELAEPGLVTLANEQAGAGLHIDRVTSLPDDNGTPLRLHDAVDALARRA
jgi:hypothetical protein